MKENRCLISRGKVCSLNAFVFQQINLEMIYLVKAAKTCFPNYLLHISEISKITACVSKLFASEMIVLMFFWDSCLWKASLGCIHTLKIKLL